MTWKSILKYENVNNMSTNEFGNKVIDALGLSTQELVMYIQKIKRDID